MKFDVFLSHNSKDKPLVEQIAYRLEEMGIKVWLDKWNLIPGDAWQEDLEEALDESQTIAVFVGPHNISPWENEEMRSAIEERVRDKKRRVIPVLLPGAPDNKALKLPRFLKRLTWVDLRTGINDEDGFHRLASGIKGLSPGKISKTSSPSSGLHPKDLQPGSYLPFPRNGYFTGRARDLEKLTEDLLGDHQTGVVVNQAITGMGGLGKTQLAVEFAYKHGYRFQGVHWLDLREAGTLDMQIALCGAKMGLSPWPITLPEQVTTTMREWFQNNPRLLILDNFEEIETVNEVLARLRHSGLRLLITSRRADWNTALGLKRLSLDEFSPQESVDFLRNYISADREADAELNKLAGHLGHLPLALELAGRYLKGHPHLKIDAYLTQLEKALEHKSMQNWKVEHKSLTGHDLSLLQTFAQSWEQVQDPQTQKLFILSGYCAPNTPIPMQIHQLALGEETEACDECLAALTGLGLLKEGFAIHPLLAQFARGLDLERAALAEFCSAFAKLANQTNHEEDRTGNYLLYSSILPHARATAEFAEQVGLEPAAGQLWNSIGYHISDLADFAGAKAAYERALKIDEATYGPDHPDVAIDVNNLGGVLKALGDHAGAKAAYERALKIFEKFLPPNHPNIRIVRGNLESLDE